MLKALIKKQANELFAILFLGTARSRAKKKKKNTKRSYFAKGTLILLLYLFLFIAICAWAFGMAQPLIGAGFDWMYYLIFGIFSLFASVAFNAFVSYNMIFKAKDNTLLLSMPIPAAAILFSRMIILFMNCIIFTGLFWLPAVLMYLTIKLSVSSLICGFLMMFVISITSLTIACLIGWFIALIVRNKTTKIILSILGSFLLIAIAFLLRASMNFLMVGLIENMNEVDKFMNENFPFILIFGRAASGEVTSFLIIFAISLILLGLIYYIMSKTFMFIVTAKTSGKHKIYKATEQKSKKISQSLFNKEFSFFFKTPVYLINTGIGSIFIIIAAIACCFAIPTLNETLPLIKELSNLPNIEFPFNILNDLIPFGILTIPIFCSALSTISTPSISIEGKTIWILKSLPINTYDIFKSKIKLHTIYCLIPSLLFTVLLSIICKETPLMILTMIVGLTAYIYLTAYFGLVIGTIRANLVWTNITIPIKQSLAIAFSMLFNIVIAGIYIAGFILLNQCIKISASIYIICFAIICVIGILIFDKWLKEAGCKRFANL